MYSRRSRSAVIKLVNDICDMRTSDRVVDFMFGGDPIPSSYMFSLIRQLEMYEAIFGTDSLVDFCGVISKVNRLIRSLD